MSAVLLRRSRGRMLSSSWPMTWATEISVATARPRLQRLTAIGWRMAHEQARTGELQTVVNRKEVINELKTYARKLGIPESCGRSMRNSDFNSTKGSSTPASSRCGRNVLGEKAVQPIATRLSVTAAFAAVADDFLYSPRDCRRTAERFLPRRVADAGDVQRRKPLCSAVPLVGHDGFLCRLRLRHGRGGLVLLRAMRCDRLQRMQSLLYAV